MGISIGLVGLGSFGSAFADLFKSHPDVSRIALCDREPERIAKFAEDPFFQDKFNTKDAYNSLDDICKADLDAIVIITQPWLHAPQCIQAMESGKHVYSAVPIISVPDGTEILDWCDKLVDTCKLTGQYYMLGETTYYRPKTMFCRRKAGEGAFGDFLYAEGEYFHDVDSDGCSLRGVWNSRTASAAGKEWLKILQTYTDRNIKSSPMHYPTHSTCGPVAVMNAHAEKVTAYGYRNSNNDPYFAHNEFSNVTALYQMSNGATARICEFREVAGSIAEEETFRILGTKGSFVEDVWKENGRTTIETYSGLKKTSLTKEEMRDPLPKEVQDCFKAAMNKKLNPSELGSIDFQAKGHGGSHPYLVHEFVDAVANNRQPAINIWEAARYMAMGVMAQKSAMKDGERLSVPDWGDAPK